MIMTQKLPLFRTSYTTMPSRSNMRPPPTQNLLPTEHRTLPHTHTHPPTQKWAMFTYVGKETTYITNLFKRTDVKIAFWTNNTVQKLLMHNRQTTDIHSRSGVYKLTCPDSKKAYVGQTGRSFAIRFQEHKMTFKTGSKTPHGTLTLIRTHPQHLASITTT